MVERFARRHRIPLSEERYGGLFGLGRAVGRSVGVLQPLTWMNLSGDSVLSALQGLHVEEPARDLLVVVDDLDLPFGRLRLRPSGGPGGHRGLASIIGALGSSRFARLRIGIGRPPAGRDAVAYVLEAFGEAEENALSGALDAAASGVEAFLADGVVPAMSQVNRAPVDDADPDGRDDGDAA